MTKKEELLAIDLWRNMERIFIFIRFDIKNNKNIQLSDAIIEIIKNNTSLVEMCNIVFHIMPEWKGKLITKNSEETVFNYKKDLELFIIKGVELMKEGFLIHNYDLAYDIADLLHALPGIVIASYKRNLEDCQKNQVKHWLRQFRDRNRYFGSLKDYWKVYVKSVQKKWDCKMFDEFKSIFH